VQKDFIANASHELRTPLTMISGQLEVSLLQSRSAEHYRKTIISVLDDVKKINLIAERLLLLAQANTESEAAFRPLRVDELLWQIKTELIKVNSLWSVYITFDPELDENDLTICGNEQLVRSALFNLMENACKYSEDHKAEVLLTRRNKSLDIRIMDNGIGISPEDMEHIFEPFHRGKNVLRINGHGIGLSLVQKIMQLHKGSITIQSELKKGTVAIIHFPSRNF
jgi:signal transduction histidine kinase